VTSFPDCAEAWLLVGAAAYQLGDAAGCVAACDRAIMLDPNLAEAYGNMGIALQATGRIDLAVVYYQSALRLAPRFTDAYNNLAGALASRGDVSGALRCYAAALEVDPKLVHVHSNMGDLWRTQGPAGSAAAAHCYSSALALQPSYAPAWRGLGDLAREGGNNAHAVECYREALRLQPGNADALCGLGAAWRALGRWAEAESALTAAASARPHCALTMAALAGVLSDSGKLDAAIVAFGEALRRDPVLIEAYNNLGNALAGVGRLQEAATAYATCIQLQCARSATAAAAAAASANATNASLMMGGNSNAAASLTSPLTLNGATLLAAANQSGGAPGAGPTAADGNSMAAAAMGMAAGGYSPVETHRLTVAYNNLGSLLKMQGQMVAAISCFEAVVALLPHSPEAAANLASMYKDMGRHDAAIPIYRRALALRPDFPEAFAHLVHSMMSVCDWTDHDTIFVRLEAETRRELTMGRLPPVQPFHAMAYPFSADLALAISKAYASHCLASAARLGVPRLPHPPPLPPHQQPGGRLRICYVSSDFGNHPLSHLMGNVFCMHNRDRVEVFCYALSPNDGSQWRQRIEAGTEHFIDASSWGTGEIAARISADGINVAINLNGYTRGARNEVFALLPAPVQVSYMGFPATTGAPFLPWLVNDAVVAPPECRHCYSESLALMPHCYFVNDYKQTHPELLEEAPLAEEEEEDMPSRQHKLQQGGSIADRNGAATPPPPGVAPSPSSQSPGVPANGGDRHLAALHHPTLAPGQVAPAPPPPTTTRASLGLPEDCVVYSCSNQLYKYDPDTFASWAAILKRVPRSVLWLLRFPPQGEDNVRRHAAAHGVDPSRIIFTDVAQKEEHIKRSRLADIFLDTPRCNAHTTGCDVLWAGCPLVTLPGERMASRVAASLVVAAGFGSELVANNHKEYEEIAVSLGLDHAKRANLVKRLKAARSTCPLFDTRQWVNDFERLLLRMWDMHCRGEPPHTFQLEAEK